MNYFMAMQDLSILIRTTKPLMMCFNIIQAYFSGILFFYSISY